MINRRLAAILAADMVGYSRLVSTDEAGALSRLPNTPSGQGPSQQPSMSGSS